MKTLLTLDTGVQRNLLVLFAAGLMFWSGLASLLPALPLYIEAAGGSSQEIGIVMGCFAIGLLLSRAWLSRMADEQGRKIVLLIGMSAIALAPLGYLLTTSIPLLMTFRAFHGISIAAFATAYSALVVDLSPPQNRGEIVGYMSLVNPLGLALGPAMGGYLYEWFGFSPLFLASAGLGMVGLVCTSSVRESKHSLKQTQTSNAEASKFWSLLFTARVRTPALILLLVGLAFGTLSTFVPLFIKEAQLTLNAGLFYTTTAIASFLIRLVAGPASDRYGRGRFITLSLVFYALAMAMIWTAQNNAIFLLAGLLQGAGSGTLIPMIAVLMADRSYPEERGRMFGLCMVGFDVGIALAGPTLGFAVTWLGYRGIFGVSALLVALGLLIFLTLSSKDIAHSLRFALGSGADLYAVELGRSEERAWKDSNPRHRGP